MSWISGALIVWALAIAATDVRARRVPNAALAAVFLLVAGSFAVTASGPLGLDAASTLIGAAIPLLLVPGHGAGWLGAGDIKLAAAMGALVGPLPLAMVLLVAGALLGATALVYRARAPRDARIPAAPMLAAGFTAVLSLAAIG